MIVMAGEKIDAETALAWGLFDRLADPDALAQAARDLAADTAGAGPVHAAIIKGMSRG